MDNDPNVSEPSLSVRERALQEKIVRLEKKLEGYQSQIGNTLKCTHLGRVVREPVNVNPGLNVD